MPKRGFKTIIDIHDVVRKTQKWATTASNSIDSEDAKLVEQVSSLHSEMVRWMVQVLLRLAPDKEGNSKEAAEMALLGSASIPQLTEVAKTLFDALETFSNYVTLCCNGIVMENTQKRQDNNEDNADYELKDLQRLRSECDDWIHTAQMLMSQLTGEPMEQLFPTRASTTLSKKPLTPPQDRVAFVDKERLQSTSSEEPRSTSEEPKDTAEESEQKTSSEPGVTASEKEATTTETEAAKEKEEEEDQPAPPPAEEVVEPPAQPKPVVDEGERIEILGYDANTHKQTIEGDKAETLGHVPVNPGVDGSPDTKRAFEALAAVQTLQTQLIAAEERAQLAEERASEAEADVVSLEEKVRALEKQLEKQQEKLERQSTSASTTAVPQSSVTTAAPSPTQTDSPRTGAEGKEEKSGRKSGRSSSKSSKKR